MRFINFLSALALITLFSCVSETKEKPEYVGVDEKAKPYFNEYTELAMKHGIIFNNNVTVGFTKINESNVIGMCSYGNKWREVDIDINFWNKHYEIEKKILVFHELTHCFCGRPHDHDTGQSYLLGASNAGDSYKSNGYFPDGCPKSIMAPVIAKPYCLDAYYDYYIDEMFNRCEPW